MIMKKSEIEALLDGTTPGPWTAVQDADDVVFHIGEGPWLADEDGFDGYHICKTTGHYVGEVSDAALIAAAPAIARTALDALARLEDAEAAQALVVERAAEIADGAVVPVQPLGVSIPTEIAEAIRALAPASGVATLAALRAELDRANGVWQANLRLISERDDALTRLAAAEGRVAALRAERDEWKRKHGELQDLTTEHNTAVAKNTIALTSRAQKAEAERDDALTRLAAAEAQVGALTDRVDDLTGTLNYLRTQAKNGTLHPQVVIQNVDAATWRAST